jgi:hypothetical protein
LSFTFRHCRIWQKEQVIEKTSSTYTSWSPIMDIEPQICDIEWVYLERMGYQVKDGQEATDTYKKALESRKPMLE